MDNEQDRAHSEAESGNNGPAAPGSQPATQSRRRFTRGAVVGSAVLLSLGNRAAWGTYSYYGGYGHKGGKGKKDKVCVSQHMLNSFVMGKGNPSAAPNDKQAEELEKFAKYYRRGSRVWEKGGKYCIREK